MKKIARSLILAVFAFLLVASFYKGIHYSNLQDLAIAAVIFALLSYFVKPIIKLLMLPFNILTLGLISSLGSIIILYLVAYFIPGVTIIPFVFSGISLSGFTLPSFHLTALMSAFLASFLIGLTTTFLQTLFK